MSTTPSPTERNGTKGILLFPPAFLKANKAAAQMADMISPAVTAAMQIPIPMQIPITKTTRPSPYPILSLVQ